MQNETEPQALSQRQLKIAELREQHELMDLMISMAFKDRLYGLLKNRDSDPEELLAYLKMNEKREAQRLKDFTAILKEREIDLNEKLAERRLALEERKQALKEKKFEYETQDLPEQETPAAQPTAPANSSNEVPAQPQGLIAPMKSTAQVPGTQLLGTDRAEKSQSNVT
jgi:hypothetical protein